MKKVLERYHNGIEFLKYLTFTTLGWKDIGIRKTGFGENFLQNVSKYRFQTIDQNIRILEKN